MVRLSLTNRSNADDNGIAPPRHFEKGLFESFLAAFRKDPDGVLRALAELVE